MPTRNRAQPDLALQTGRIIYGDNGSNSYAIAVEVVNGLGRIILGASTTNIGDVDVLATKTIQTELLASSAIAASVVVASSVLALTGIKQATFFIDHGRAGTGAFTTNGTQYLVQASEKAAGNDTWRTLANFYADSAAASSALSSGAVGAGTTVITILSGTAFAANDLVMWANTADAANSTEWARVVSVSGTASFTILDGITNAQGSTVVITNKAEHFTVTVDTHSITRARVVVNNNASATTQAIRSRVACITEL